jgi:hypothetical protein
MTHTVGQPRHDAPPNGHDTPVQEPAETRSRRTAAVPLRRLLGLATLTPAQAVHIAVEMLTALQPESESYGAFDTDDVLVDEDGSIRLVEHEFTPGTASAAGEVAQRLAGNADRPAAHRRPAYATLLSALKQAAADLSRGDLAAPLAELRRELEASGVDRARLQHELAALVSVPLVRVGAEPTAPATPKVEAPARPNVIVDPATVEPETESAPSIDMPVPPTSVVRRLPPRPLIVLVAVVVVALVALVAALLNNSDGGPTNANTTDQPVNSSHASSTPPPAARNTGPRAVPQLAPRSAGPISKVTFDPAGHCHADAACTATVRIWLRPPGLTSLKWHAALVDRCTGKIRTIDNGSMIAEQGWRSAYTTVRLHLPQKSSMAVLAVVDSPISAASRPVLVPSGGGSCG